MTEGRRGRTGLAVLLGLVGGLLLVGGTTASWVVEQGVSDVAGVQVATPDVGTSGVEFAPVALPIGLAAVVGSLALGLPSPRVRRVLGILLALAGIAGLGGLVAGVLRAMDAGHGVAPAPGAAAAGGFLILVAGALVLRPAPPPRLSARYDLDDGADDEWDLASAEDEEIP